MLRYIGHLGYLSNVLLQLQLLLLNLWGPVLKAQDLPSPSPAWDHLPAGPFPSSQAVSFQQYLFPTYCMTTPEERGEEASGDGPASLSIISKDALAKTHWNQSEIHTTSKGKEVCRRQMCLNSPLSFIIVEGDNFDWAKRMIMVF